MIGYLISWSLKNRIIVLLFALGITAYGIYTVKNTPVDAIPDLSENQVIIFTEWMGRNPQIIEDQITYPLVSNLQGIPKVKNIRVNSMFGMSFVFVIFDDDVDIYWARTRVLERLNYAQHLLPDGIAPTLGPDGTGLGHIYWYTLDAPGYDHGELRALQDWYIRFALQTTEGVSEVSLCGHKKAEIMPKDTCQYFYECENCKKVIIPKKGDCYVYCSYGTVKCPSKQTEAMCC